MTAVRHTVVLASLFATLASCGGCATLAGFHQETDTNLQADAEHPISQIVCLWQPAAGRGLDNLPARGFAGQIAFMTAHSPTPVEVEGDVTIYLFDDQGPAAEQAKPIHVFRFADGSWQTHLKETAWGPTYQIFIPYVRPGQHAAQCTLAVKLEASFGQRISSELANISLRGSEATESELSQQSTRPAPALPSQVAPAGYQPAMRQPVPGRPPAQPNTTVLGTPPPSNPAEPHFRSFSIPYTESSWH